MKKLALAIFAAAVSAVGASAADMAPAPRYAKAPVAPVLVYSWTGFYIGATAGGDWGRSDANTSIVFSPVGYFAASSVPVVNAAGLQRINSSGFNGGIEAGYNWQANNFVLGVEGDFESFHINGSSSGTGVFPCCVPSGFTITSNVRTDWLATIRGRIGFAVDRVLFFATGGAAFTNLKGNFAYTDNCFQIPACGGGPGGPLTTEAVSLSSTKTGYAVGAGVEGALWGNWTVKAEYLYVNFGTISGTGLIAGPPIALLNGTNNNPFTHSLNLSSNIVRVGLNYKFAGPVVAKF